MKKPVEVTVLSFVYMGISINLIKTSCPGYKKKETHGQYSFRSPAVTTVDLLSSVTSSSFTLSLALVDVYVVRSRKT